jgi:anion-transporting  ArsA/GET3 family ATPase
MDPLQFFAACRLVIVAGKGGVGKTTVTAAMAVAAARVGRRVLVVELEGASGLGPLFGSTAPLTSDDVVLRPETDSRGEIIGRVVSPGDALTDYLNDHGMRRLSGRLVRSGVIDVVATAAPGLDDILVLGKVKQLERIGAYDLILLDAPAAGHAVTFLRSAKGLADAVTVGPIAVQARDVLELLADPSRCQVVLVTLPEEMPVNEVVTTAFALEDEVGVQLGPVVINGLYPERPGLAEALAAHGVDADDGLAQAARFRLTRQQQQREQVARLSAQLPLAQIQLPFRFTAGLAPEDLERLADALLDQLAILAA